MPLALDFPPTSAEWIFFVAFAVILVGPLLFERIGFPGIVGVIIGGLLIGPGVLDWVPREGVVESLGDLGILFLMSGLIGLRTRVAALHREEEVPPLPAASPGRAPIAEGARS